jgi:NAD-dependent deacetylase
MSAESGIPTYRGKGGLWTSLGEPDPRSYDTFLADPKAWWEKSMNLNDAAESEARRRFRSALETGKPNAGHYALAHLEQVGFIRHTITQNVDGLHRMAGSRKLSEIHGNRLLLRCMDCSLRLPRAAFRIRKMPPLCPECGGIIKSDGVMFGEPIPRDVLSRCIEETIKADCVLVLGTSGTVYPAAGFPLQAKDRGAYLIEINLNETPISDISDISLRLPTGEALPQIAARILKNLPAH